MEQVSLGCQQLGTGEEIAATEAEAEAKTEAEDLGLLGLGRTCFEVVLELSLSIRAGPALDICQGAVTEAEPEAEAEAVAEVNWRPISGECEGFEKGEHVRGDTEDTEGTELPLLPA